MIFLKYMIHIRRSTSVHSLLFSSHVCDPIQGGLGFEVAEVNIGAIEKANIQYF